MIVAKSSEWCEGEKRLDEIEIGDMVKLPHSEAFWPVLWTTATCSDSAPQELIYSIKVRGVVSVYTGHASDLLPCFIHNQVKGDNT